MANELNTLIERVSAHDPSLAAELRRQVTSLTGRRANGLNFERHLPEQVTLVGRPITVGDKVRFIPERGETKVESDATWVVTSLTGPKGGNIAELLDRATGETANRAVEDLVFVADFRDPIYPGLVSTGRVERGGDKPFHTVINSENYHALEALTFTHAGKVDAIYIDPPYNTGARDWKYNNDYVDDTDAYRHSKWLSFMERRLQVVKKLLNPKDSVLIVTIDEKEYLRLGLLLEQTFPNARIQMATIVINPNGVSRGREMARVEEYAFFVFVGDAGPALVEDALLDSGFGSTQSSDQSVRWERMMRGGSNSRRADRPNLFYPVFVDPTDKTIKQIGEPLPLEQSPQSVATPDGLVAVWPVRANGAEANWRVSPDYLRELLNLGYARVGSYDKKNDRWSLGYLGKAQIRRIEQESIVIVGRRDDGSVLLEAAEQSTKRMPKTVWNRPSHKAGEYGSALVKKLTMRGFPFPKSLYAVEDTLRTVIADKPDALVLDFFSGSGTTAHAVMRLNKQDGGHRRSISVTNNEVEAPQVLRRSYTGCGSRVRAA